MRRLVVFVLYHFQNAGSTLSTAPELRNLGLVIIMSVIGQRLLTESHQPMNDCLFFLCRFLPPGTCHAEYDPCHASVS
ncbi:hypothetical protein EDB82DRAFT_494602 [Fusarium venenatum]|uniref:uncharacterized protein n=1 Tax=Fusarium venenatum TaxID=56646 RepID=UPI001D74B5DF|nr:hypothetical protein EDB82DRAFT_494602 [Fusarium venenatum]